MTNAEIGRIIWLESIQPDKPKIGLKPKLAKDSKISKLILHPGFVLSIKPDNQKNRGIRVIYSRPDMNEG